MNKYQLFALDHFLTDYPKDASFEEIVEMVEDEDEDVCHWEPYENLWGEHVAEMITDMARELEVVFYARH